MQPVRVYGPTRRSRWIAAGLALVALITLVLALRLGAPDAVRPFGDRPSATVLVIGADEPQNGRSRSDTVLFVTITLEPKRHLSVLSLPRDSRVHIPGATGFHKLNAAFQRGGAPLLRRTVEKNLGLHPDYALTLDTRGMAELIDSLGGVEIDVPQRMDYDDRCANLHIHLRPGRQHLDGAQAVRFVRFRKDARGDLGRVARQQLFVRAMARQALTPATLANWGHIQTALRHAFRTELTDAQLAGLVLRLRGLTSDEMGAATLPGRPQTIGGVSYFVPHSARRPGKDAARKAAKPQRNTPR